MPLYMTQFSYTPEAWAALVENPEDRSAILGRLVESFGGRLVSFYYCRGEYDGVAIMEAPDDITGNAIAFAALSAGHLKATKTTELFEAEDVMEALRRAGTATYRGPGQMTGAAPPGGEPPAEEHLPRQGP
jgi:uncharacterized protein with GYD domain